MSVTKTIVTPDFYTNSAKKFLESFNDSDYYMYFGNHIPYANGDGVIDEPSNSVQSLKFDLYNNMIFSKKISEQDISLAINNYEWESGTKYEEYDHQTDDLLNKKFYIVVNDSSEYNVYKCLFNNNTKSTVAPSRVGNSSDLLPITTGDGYIWKYMFTIPKADYDKFATNKYVPVVANNQVIESSVGGTIEVIKILNSGSGYTNFIENGVFRSGDINVGGIDTIFGAPETAQTIDDFYRGCIIKITSGNGVNQFRKIVNYSGSGSQRLFTLEKPFTTNPRVGDSYEVYPHIFVWGDGSESISAEAIAIIDSETNSISDIEVLNVGKGYRAAQSFVGQTPFGEVGNGATFIDLPTVISSSSDFVQADLYPIISPPEGHGKNPYAELGANKVCVSVNLLNSEGGTIPTENDFRQVGIIKSPLFNNVDLILDSNNRIGNFSIGETVYQYNEIKLAGKVDLVNGSSNISLSNSGKISTSVEILNSGTGYDSTLDDTLVFDNSSSGGSGASGTFANDSNGSITSVNIINDGNNYDSPPIVTINSTASSDGQNAQLSVSLANDDDPTFDEAFEVNDYVLIKSDDFSLLSTIRDTPSKSTLTISDQSNTNISNCEISALKVTSSGTVNSTSLNQINVSNVKGRFNLGHKVVGRTSSSLGIIREDVSSIMINDKTSNIFNTTVQLSRLIGNFSSGSSPFEKDELIRQNNLISYIQPNAILHHSDISDGTDDDVLHVSNISGIFNRDSTSSRTIIGTNSLATLDNLSNIYEGDFVKDSGEVIYYENLDAITRSGNKSETIKIIFNF